MSKVTLHTNQGDIALKLYRRQGHPRPARTSHPRQKRLLTTEVIFHRVISRLQWIQGATHKARRGGKSIWGASFEDEVRNGLSFDRKGILAMANAGPATNGSQFFITLAPTAWLTDKHTIFGEVEAGMDVVDKIGSCQKGPGDRPHQGRRHRALYRRGVGIEGSPLCVLGALVVNLFSFSLTLGPADRQNGFFHCQSP